VEANSTGGHGSRRAVAPSDDDEISLTQKATTAHDTEPVQPTLCDHSIQSLNWSWQNDFSIYPD
jgi:hypothetical protein